MEKRARTGRRNGRGRAFALLYAVMTSSIILAVGVSIISIALKQLSISTLGRESQYAFYAANAGAECALYWDFHGVLKPVAGSTSGENYQRLAVFSSPFLPGGSEVVDNVDEQEVTCVGRQLMQNRSCTRSDPLGPDDSWCESSDGAIADTTEFTVFFGRDEVSGDLDVEGPCARVSVSKVRGSSSGGTFSPGASGSNLETTIDSRGYNYCSEDNTRRVERGLRFTY